MNTCPAKGCGGQLDEDGFCSTCGRVNGRPSYAARIAKRQETLRARAVANVIASKTTRHTGGYVLLYCPWHPAAHRGYVYEHRVIAERQLGRALVPGEEVHHINGAKDDNRPENLAVVSRREHMGHHRPLGDAEIRELVARGYGYKDIEALGVGSHTIRRVRREMGVPKSRRVRGRPLRGVPLAFRLAVYRAWGRP